jgi:hypothetical protein
VTTKQNHAITRGIRRHLCSIVGINALKTIFEETTGETTSGDSNADLGITRKTGRSKRASDIRGGLITLTTSITANRPELRQVANFGMKLSYKIYSGMNSPSVGTYSRCF